MIIADHSFFNEGFLGAAYNPLWGIVNMRDPTKLHCQGKDISLCAPAQVCPLFPLKRSARRECLQGSWQPTQTHDAGHENQRRISREVARHVLQKLILNMFRHKYIPQVISPSKFLCQYSFKQTNSRFWCYCIKSLNASETYSFNATTSKEEREKYNRLNWGFQCTETIK